jgi:hypothetical protein
VKFHIHFRSRNFSKLSDFQSRNIHIAKFRQTFNKTFEGAYLDSLCFGVFHFVLLCFGRFILASIPCLRRFSMCGAPLGCRDVQRRPTGRNLSDMRRWLHSACLGPFTIFPACPPFTSFYITRVNIASDLAGQLNWGSWRGEGDGADSARNCPHFQSRPVTWYDLTHGLFHLYLLQLA